MFLGCRAQSRDKIQTSYSCYLPEAPDDKDCTKSDTSWCLGVKNTIELNPEYTVCNAIGQKSECLTHYEEFKQTSREAKCVGHPTAGFCQVLGVGFSEKDNMWVATGEVLKVGGGCAGKECNARGKSRCPIGLACAWKKKDYEPEGCVGDTSRPIQRNLLNSGTSIAKTSIAKTLCEGTGGKSAAFEFQETPGCGCDISENRKDLALNILNQGEEGDTVYQCKGTCSYNTSAGLQNVDFSSLLVDEHGVPVSSETVGACGDDVGKCKWSASLTSVHPECVVDGIFCQDGANKILDCTSLETEDLCNASVSENQNPYVKCEWGVAENACFEGLSCVLPGECAADVTIVDNCSEGNDDCSKLAVYYSKTDDGVTRLQKCAPDANSLCKPSKFSYCNMTTSNGK